MKRDMDLIRAVLLKAQHGDPNGKIDDRTDDELKYHRALAIDAGLLKGSIVKDSTKGTEIPAAVMVKDLTWEGHDFLDAIENDSNWAKVKEFLHSAGKQLTLETIKFAIKQLFGVGGV